MAPMAAALPLAPPLLFPLSLFSLFSLLSLLIAFSLSASAGPTCQVAQFGARGDGLHYDTEAIQSAIDTCQGGGRVLIPSGGRFLTATLYLRSHLVLEIEENATLLGGTSLSDFPWLRNHWYTLLGDGVTNVTLTGSGTIHGQAQSFVTKYDVQKNVMVSWNETGQCLGDECRPRLVGFIESSHIKVFNVHFHEPAYWCLHFVRCQHTHVANISIYGDFNIPNNDGIDIDGSNHTIVEGARIDTGDDAICPKSTAGPVLDLSVTNCRLKTKSCAVKVGSGTEHDFKDLHFENLVVEDSHRGLGLQLRDQGNIENVTFKNIHISTRYYDPSWWGRAEPIYVTACPRNPTSNVGSIKNIFFTNISIVAENGIFLSGSPSSRLQGLVFSGLTVDLRRWTQYQEGEHDYRPGCQGMIKHEISGIFMEYIDSVTMENVSLSWGNSSWRMPMEINPLTVREVQVNGFQFNFLNMESGKSLVEERRNQYLNGSTNFIDF